MRMRTYSRTLKTTSAITLAFFLWSFGPIWQAVAFAATPQGQGAGGAGVRSSEFGVRSETQKTATTSGRFEKALEEIREKISRADEKDLKKQDITTEITEVKKRRAEIDSLDVELKKEFSATEKKLKDAKLSKEILDRHYKFVKHYEDNLNELKTNLAGIEQGVESKGFKEALQRTKLHLEKTKPTKKHVPLDPNKLPNRMVKAKARAPRLKKEEFERDFPTQKKSAHSSSLIASNHELKATSQELFYSAFRNPQFKIQRKPILVAANGPLTGLLSSSSKPVALPLRQSSGHAFTGNGFSSQINPATAYSDSQSAITNEPRAILLAQATVTPPTSDDLSETPEVQFTPEIQALATQLNHNPVKIYGWVRNNIIYEPYYGSFKGAQQTLSEGAGNDFDQASLLIALLRVSGIAAKYSYGTIEIPDEKVMNWVGGVSDPIAAATILATQGIPVKTVMSGGTVKAIQMEKVWVEAFIDYFPSWGARHKPGGEDAWIPLDPSFKLYTFKQGMDMYAEMGFNAEEFLMSYITDTRDITAYQDYSMRMISFLDANYPDAEVEDILGASEIKQTKTIVKQEFPYLLGTLPYKVIVKAAQFSEAPATQDYAITIQIEGDALDGTNGLSYTGGLNDLGSKRVTVSYDPASSSDEALIAQYGGNVFSVPPYLLNVKPVLRINGAAAATGGSIGMGKDQSIVISFAGSDGDTDRIQNIITAGAYSAIILQSQNTPVDTPSKNMAKLIENSKKVDSPDITLDDLLGQILYSIGVSYFHTLSFENEVFAKSLQLLSYRQPSEAMVTQDVKVDYVFGMPRSLTAGGIGIDVDRNVNVVYSTTQDKEREKAYMILSGLASSVSENRILEAFFNIPSVSAVRLLKMASEQGIPVYTINKSNVSDILPLLQVGEDVKTDIANAINAGKRVIVHQSKITFDQWVGAGYIVIDPTTGAGSFMISGGLGGAKTKKAPIAYPNFIVTWDMKVVFEAARSQILGFASEMNGTLYVFGATGGGIDCSSFTALCYEKAGITLLKGKTAAGQYNYSLITENPMWADLVFFKGSYDKNCDGIKDPNDGVTHVAIFVSWEFMISAQGKKVEMVEISSWGELYPSYCPGTLTCDEYKKGVCTNDAGKKIKWVPNEDADPYDPFAGYGKIIP